MIFTKTKKMLKNKRGEDMMVDFFAILVFAIVVLLFFVLFKSESLKNKTNEITLEMQNKDIDFMLNSFLKAPAIGFDSDKTVADIIIEDYISDDHTRTEILFKEFYSHTEYYNGNKVNDISLEIHSGKNSLKTFEVLQEGSTGAIMKLIKIPVSDYNSYTTITKIPVYGDSIYVHLKIFTWKEDSE